MTDGHADDILVRLCSIEGHLRGLQQMVRSERSCAEILLQISAVQGALRQVALNMLEVEIEGCMRSIEGANNQTDFETGLQRLSAIYKVGWQGPRGQ